MADFPTYDALLTKTEVLSADLDAATPVTTDLIPVGAGTFPFEAYATGVDFYVTTTDGTAAIGNLTFNVQCSADGATWYTVASEAFVGPVPNAQAFRKSVQVNARQWRFIRGSFLCQNAQSGTLSTVVVDAQLRGLHRPYTTTTA